MTLERKYSVTTTIKEIKKMRRNKLNSFIFLSSVKTVIISINVAVIINKNDDKIEKLKSPIFKIK
ncbi:MAG: hypothetical protein HamCj_20760 [Candidatus Hamiltonella defensa (Ceratovacuna japonica)]